MSTLTMRVPDTYHLITPDGKKIQVTREVYSAFQLLSGPQCPNGSIVIEFKTGGIASVQVMMKTVLK